MRQSGLRRIDLGQNHAKCGSSAQIMCVLKLSNYGLPIVMLALFSMLVREEHSEMNVNWRSVRFLFSLQSSRHKVPMKTTEGTRSPNIADAVMMAFWPSD